MSQSHCGVSRHVIGTGQVLATCGPYRWPRGDRTWCAPAPLSMPMVNLSLTFRPWWDRESWTGCDWDRQRSGDAVRFTGQVRVPEVDHPGVPATFLVEEGQAEVLLEGESLGRWSLFDVHASRLVSAAFSVSLDGDEITFIADEPVDFAYKGSTTWPKSWARYKAMTLPRRMIAVSRSRRGTRPSRIAELRQAMLANLEVYANSAGDLDVAEVEELEPRDRLHRRPALS